MLCHVIVVTAIHRHTKGSGLWMRRVGGRGLQLWYYID